MFSKALLVMSRIIEGALIIVGVAFLVLDDSIEYLAIWDFIAVIYMIIRIRRLIRSKRSTTKPDEWLKETLGGRGGLLFTLFTSLTGILAGLMIVIGSGNADDDLLAKVFAVPAVLLAWAILHFGYAERYAQDYYAALPEQSLVFPNVEKPTFIDFAYFSFTLGTTFSVSDVETQTSAIRLRVLSHSVLAFIYNTATVGIAVSVITG